ncbi:MAG: ABC transporter substrate-binding protein [Chloroflexota bacterium]|nr:ABC transporter substrate-binding protein [Dehalococcoidia bacterium]MDW8253131.1 ABC transporter substrate-binding protein [Chloroflexota bacterium]
MFRPLPPNLLRPLAALALVGVACAPAAPTQTAGSVTGPVMLQDFKLNIAISTSITTLDPHAAIGNNPRRYGLYECLVAQDEAGRLEPALASSWRNVDATTWEFKLAPNRKFHDGSPVTAEDVKYSLDRATNPELRLAILARTGTIDQTTIVDPSTIRITTKGPDPILLKRVALVVIVPKAYLERIGPAEFATKGMGTGPYMVKEFNGTDRLLLVANPHYPTKPGASEILVRSVPEASARIAGLRTGELDLIDNVPIDQYEAVTRAGMQVIVFNQGQTIGAFIFSTLAGEPTQNKLVRQAINYAVDKEAIARDIFKGLTRPTGQVVQTTTVGYNPNIRPYPYDPARARQLLAQAGYPTGFRIRMAVTLGTTAAEPTFLLIQSNLRDVGIEAAIEQSADSAFLLDHWYGRTQRAHILTAGLLNSPAMDADFALTWFRGNEPEPARRHNDPEFDRYYLASLTEMDEKKRVELLQKAIEVMYENPPFLFLVDGVRLWAASSKLENVIPRGDQEPRFDIIRKKA